jgi:hypothetical protein
MLDRPPGTVPALCQAGSAMRPRARVQHCRLACAGLRREAPEGPGTGRAVGASMAIFDVPGQFHVGQARYVPWFWFDHDDIHGLFVMLLAQNGQERCLRHLQNIGHYNEAQQVFHEHIAPLIDWPNRRDYYQTTINGAGWQFVFSWSQAHLLLYHIHPPQYKYDDKKGNMLKIMQSRMNQGGSYQDRMKSRLENK